MTHAIKWTQLTFGIELEMICSVKHPSNTFPTSSTFDTVRETVLSQLRDIAGVSAQLVHKTGNESELPIQYDSKTDLPSPDDEDSDYTVWGVQFDNSVDYTLDDIHDMYPELPILSRYNGQDRIALARPRYEMVYHNPIEVVSRVLRIADTRTWGREIQRVLKAVSCNRLRPFVTDTAGFHVHIGLGDHSFPLEAVKKIGAVVVLAERTMDLFHEEHRRDNKKNIAPLITKEGFSRLTREGVFDKIMGANDLDEFLDTVNGRKIQWNEAGEKEELVVRWRYYKVNFTYLQPCDPKGTIEFRQHAATLDYVEIQMWIRFLGLLVVYASAMDVRVLRNILVSSADKDGIIPPIGFICSFIRDEPVARYYLDKIGVKLIIVR
ncbi:putative amidoligase [Trichophaea hybrida]|nr:putative amidoligase [Trichophaea hybrida]